MVNFIQNSVAQFGVIPTVVTSFALGMASYPLIKRITKAAIEAISYIAKSLFQSELFTRIRAFGCDRCFSMLQMHPYHARNSTPTQITNTNES